MGKRSSQRRTSAMFDSDDTDSMSSSSTASAYPMSVGLAEEVEKDTLLDEALDDLFEKRATKREAALVSIIDSFSTQLQHEFVEKKFATLLHQCLNSIKKGSAKEIHLASRAVGLLTFTTGNGEKAREILKESSAPITQALRTRSDSVKTPALLECLAIITFIGGVELEETEKAMQIMWQVVHPKLGINVVASKPSPAVITAMISAWAFLFTTVEIWSLGLEVLTESMSYLSSLLEKEERGIRIAAGEALALIFEAVDFKRYAGDDNNPKEGYVRLQGIRRKVVNQVTDLASEAGGKGSGKKDLSTQRNLFRDILDFIEDGYAPETSTKVGGDSLCTSSWSELIQLNFVKHFFGKGFIKHMQENEFLHEVFDFQPTKKTVPVSGAQANSKLNEKRVHAVVSKAWKQHLNKQRMVQQDRKAGHFAVGYEE